jgi:hypothetical protein
MQLTNRLITYTRLSQELADLTDVQLSDLLDNSQPMHSGIGGSSSTISINDTRVFVKKVPLTDLERQPQHFMSTANLFELPLFYQYGIGSTGFGAWRELAAHTMTTNWVLSQECPNFPVLYHWRVLPTSKSEPMNSKELAELNYAVEFWADSPAVRNRLASIHDASAHIVLFLEFFPETLYRWFANQFKADSRAGELAISFVEENLKTTNDFFNVHGFSHFDAHFENTLIDVDATIVVSDFGLALSSNFDLTEDEREFLDNHRNYDRCASMISLVHCIITGLFGKDQWGTRLRDNLDGKRRDFAELSPSIAATIKKYAPVALVMDDFYRSLHKNDKLTPYPAVQLERLILALC